MARVTVEDCIDKVENRFDLVLIAAHRARMIASGAAITVDRDNDKNAVVSLREIADATLTPEDLKEDFIHSLQKHVEVDEPEAEAVPALTPAVDKTPIRCARRCAIRPDDGRRSAARPGRFGASGGDRRRRRLSRFGPGEMGGSRHCRPLRSLRGSPC